MRVLYQFSSSQFFLLVSCASAKIWTFFRRQIPFAIGQFTVNEFCHELVYRNISENKRKSLTATSRFGIDLGSGIIAGFAAAALSQVKSLLLFCNQVVAFRHFISHSLRILCSAKLTKDKDQNAPWLVT